MTDGDQQQPTGQRRARSAGQGNEADAATRAALVQGALDTARAHGVAGATSRRIAAAAGANLAAITYWFGSKDALVAEAVFGDLERRLAPVLDGLEADGPPVIRLMGALRDLTAELERSADDVPLYLDALVLGSGPSPLAERGRQLMIHLRQRLAAVIRVLVSDGAVAAWIEPEAMASLLIAAANGTALQTRLDPEGPAVSAVAAQLANLLLAAGSASG